MNVLRDGLRLLRYGLAMAVPFVAIATGLLVPNAATALPTFARQTGQNCVACHAGGQFPELTPYGRLFKMTGYTIGTRTLPLAVMAVASAGSVSNTTDPNTGNKFAKNGQLLLTTESIFLAGKITNNIGAFVQVTHDNYNDDVNFVPLSQKWTADNVDFRYADHWIEAGRDVIFGVSLNNNPSVTDPWNTAPAWMQYIPTLDTIPSNQFADGVAGIYPGTAAGGPLTGLNVYALWNNTLYGEIGFYHSADKLFSFMAAGTNADARTWLRGSNNPYWRLAYTHDWGANSLMIGTSGMVAHVYGDSSDLSGRSDSGNYQRVKTIGLDAQYQYLLDPHTVSGQLAYTKETLNDTANNGGAKIDSPRVLRGKLTYVYQAKYGGSLAYFRQSDAMDRTGAVNGGLGDTNGMTYELFWTPIQYARVGAQYTAYNKYLGASHDYDGNGRDASDNNTLLFYIWASY